MITTLTEYAIGAKRTIKDMGSYQMNHLHMQMGCMTEIGEMIDVFKIHHIYNKAFDNVHLNEEYGDTGWYIFNDAVLACQTAEEIQMLGLDRVSLQSRLASLQQEYPFEMQRTNVYEIVQSWIKFIGKQVAPLHWKHSQMITLYLTIGLRMGVNVQQALTKNIEKLQARYPDKYTDFAALNRNLDKERSVLES